MIKMSSDLCPAEYKNIDLIEENKFLKQWKDDVMESLCKYDANSVEEVYNDGVIKGISECIDILWDTKQPINEFDDVINTLEMLKKEYKAGFIMRGIRREAGIIDDKPNAEILTLEEMSKAWKASIEKTH